MIIYLCNKCKKPIDLTKKYCAHMQVTWGAEAVLRSRQSESDCSIDLCEECFKSILKQIDFCAYIKNELMKEEV